MRKEGLWVGALVALLVIASGARSEEKHLTGATYVDWTTPKAASTNTVASRGGVSASNPIFGGFQLATSTTVYILVRGNSLSTLGVTSNYLDAPRVRLYNQSGQDLVTDGSGQAGFNACLSTNGTTDLPVINYYASRGAVQPRDACLAVVLQAGAYTFSVTPSIPGVTTSSTASAPGSGEILFEVTLGPAGAVVNTNRTQTERLVGGTWTFLYTIISTFSERYTFSTVTESTTTPGDYVALGADQFGDLVIGSYNSSLQLWGVLDKSILLDRFFTFTFSGNNNISGCYYQITPPGSTNLGTCYPLTGSRFPPKIAAKSGTDLQLLEEARAFRSEGAVDPRVVDAYMRARDDAAKRRAQQ